MIFNILQNNAICRNKFCSNVGLSSSAAIHMFVKTVINERRIPFEVRDPNASDTEALKKGIEQLNAGRGIVKTTEELEAMILNEKPSKKPSKKWS